MRLFVVAALLLSQVSFARANCRVFIPEREFHHDSGYSINFNFQALLRPKNYTEVPSREEADQELIVKGTEQTGRIHRALARMEMGNLKVEDSVMCFTQLCGVGDYAQAFNKVYKKFSKQLPVCR